VVETALLTLYKKSRMNGYRVTLRHNKQTTKS